METLLAPEKEALYRKIVIAVSILIPGVVAFLILMPQTGKLGDFDVSAFPAINATLNSLTSLCLVMALFAIRSKNILVHKVWMTTAFFLSACFLILYVLYHFQGPATRYGDSDHNGMVDDAEKLAAGSLRMVYFVVLVLHIILAAIVLPFILLSFYFSLSNQIVKHKRIVRFTFPVWLFVATSGVLVYFMIRPYYPF